MRRAVVMSLVLSAVTLLLAPQRAQAGPSMSATIQKQTLKVGEATTMQIEVSGQFRGHPDFRSIAPVSVSQVSQKTQTSIRQGASETRTIFGYRVVGRAVGKAKLGPARLTVDGVNLRSDYFEIEVIRGSSNTRAASPPPSRPGSRPEANTASGPPGQPGGDYFATADIQGPLRPYVGESFIYRVEAASAVQKRGIEWEQPSVSPLATEPGLDFEQRDRQEIIDGRRYTVNTIDLPLFAIEPGTVRIEPARFTMAVVRSRGLFGTTSKVNFETNPVDVELQALPREGRPVPFSGAVGTYSLEAHLDRDQLDAGETATLIVRIRGIGALRGEELQTELPEAIRAYHERPKIETRLERDGVRSQATYQSALVPLEPGSFTIPPVTFSFFDPASKTYRTARSAPLRMEVGGSPVIDAAVLARSASLGRAKEQVEVLGVDILPLHTQRRTTGNQYLSPAYPGILAGLALPFLGFLGIAARASRRRFAGTDAGRQRQRRREGRAAVKGARDAARAKDLSAAEDCLKTYLFCRLGARGPALSPAEGGEVLVAAGAQAELAEGLSGLLRWQEGARYGGASPDGLPTAIHEWLDRAEAEWP